MRCKVSTPHMFGTPWRREDFYLNVSFHWCFFLSLFLLPSLFSSFFRPLCIYKVRGMVLLINDENGLGCACFNFFQGRSCSPSFLAGLGFVVLVVYSPHRATILYRPFQEKTAISMGFVSFQLGKFSCVNVSWGHFSSQHTIASILSWSILILLTPIN